MLALSALYLLIVIYQNRSVFLRPFDPQRATSRYNNSQWQQSQNFAPIKILDAWAEQRKYANWNHYVEENKTKVNVKKTEESIIQAERSKGISDAELYAYAGYRYMQGTNPTLLNPEHPPLGKYLIGLSITLFRNENIGSVLAGFMILILVFAIVKLATNNALISSAAVLLTATQTLFVDQIIHGPELEIYQVLFFLALLLLLQLLDKYNRCPFAVAAGIAFGCFLSVKTFATHYPLLLVWLLLLLALKRLKLRDFITVNITGILVFLASYSVYFLDGGTLRKWLGVQKYIVLFYKQSGINTLAFLGNYLRLIATGYWKFWSDNMPVTRYSEWSLMWPVVFLAGLYAMIKFLSDKNRKPFINVALVLFIALYNLFLFFVPIFPRYLLLLFLPFIILIGTVTKFNAVHEKK